jgi:hypothetical protein
MESEEEEGEEQVAEFDRVIRLQHQSTFQSSKKSRSHYCYDGVPTFGGGRGKRK